MLLRRHLSPSLSVPERAVLRIFLKVHYYPFLYFYMIFKSSYSGQKLISIKSKEMYFFIKNMNLVPGSTKVGQREFFILMEDAIRQPDISKSIQRLQIAIDKANVRLDLAVSPGTWLMPSNLVFKHSKYCWV